LFNLTLSLTCRTNEEQRVHNENLEKQNTTQSLSFFNLYESLLNSRNETTNGEPELEKVNEEFYTLVYTSLIVAMFITIFIRSFTFFLMCTKSSIKLHNQIFDRLLSAPMTFFENNPTGRILNRFSKDIGTVDEFTPSTAFDINLVRNNLKK